MHIRRRATPIVRTADQFVGCFRGDIFAARVGPAQTPAMIPASVSIIAATTRSVTIDGKMIDTDLHHFAKSLQRRWPNLPAGAKPIASNIIEQVKNLPPIGIDYLTPDSTHRQRKCLLDHIAAQMTMFRERMQGEG